MTTYFSATELLSPPTERAAFSDRQACVCAELSKLAYFKFEGGHTYDQVLEIAKEFIDDESKFKIVKQKLSAILSGGPNSEIEAKIALSNILAQADFKLIETFSTQGTQAFLCTKEIKLDTGGDKTSAFLVYRGTEPNDFRDIKSDINAKLMPVKPDENDDEIIELHTGYYEAFCLIKGDLEKILNKTKFDQFFITGHSLGGALAAVTTRMLASSVNGACYTYGAPPIGSVSVQNKLKTPVYHIINELDVVPRLPNPWSASVIIWLMNGIRLFLKLFTVTQKILAYGTWDDRLETYIETMTRYRHPGYRSYLVGSSSEARLRFNVSSFDLFKWWFALIYKMRIFQIRKVVDDHSIDLYVDKLKQHALKRV